MEGGGIPGECQATFPGSGPFSEVETRNYRDFLVNNPSINQVISVHSYGQVRKKRYQLNIVLNCGFFYPDALIFVGRHP
jgi:hypothetical protein